MNWLIILSTIEHTQLSEHCNKVTEGIDLSVPCSIYNQWLSSRRSIGSINAAGFPFKLCLLLSTVIFYHILITYVIEQLQWLRFGDKLPHTKCKISLKNWLFSPIYTKRFYCIQIPTNQWQFWIQVPVCTQSHSSGKVGSINIQSNYLLSQRSKEEKLFNFCRLEIVKILASNFY